ncbi:MAG: chain length-determining protein [Gammaproteobacteria bacterium]|nr:MAG: chain length-determining protein [Gammaproteobacteria bacterium]
MHEVVSEVLAQARGASRFKWVAIIAAWAICLSGWVFVSQIPDEYEASARVHVDTRTVLRPLMSGLAIQQNVGSQVRLMSKLLFSRSNLEKVARMTDLDLNAKDDEGMQALVGSLKSMLSISSARQLNLFTISAQNKDPKLAKRLVQSLLTIFIEETLGESRKDSDTAQRFIDQQINEYEKRLVAAEKMREQFKRENYGSLPGQGGSHYDRLQSYAAQLEEAKLAIDEAINRRNELKRQLEDEEPMFEDFGGGFASSPLDARIQSLQAQIDSLLLKYTERHPEIRILRQTITDLEKQKEEEPDFAEDEEEGFYGGVGVGQTSPVFQQMKIALGEANANVASLKGRVETLQKRIENTKQAMGSSLEVETKLKSLNRDYLIIKSNYEALLERRETARMSENIEQNTDSVKFRIIDPPQVPTEPSVPNRILLSSGVLVGGLVVGLGLALLLSLLRPVYLSPQKVREITGLPILGSVSMNWVPSLVDARRRRLWMYSLVSFTLVVAFGAVIVLEVMGLNLSSI